MTDCQDWLTDITHTAHIVLDEDLAALGRFPEQSRIERYNELKANEEELMWEFSKECSEYLTDEELNRLRGELRLARLLIAASFYVDGEVPSALEGDFIDAELQAVADFDRYKQFDALDEAQIEGRIRRMEGEVYELVKEYTSTQIADMDDLIENPDVQQDVIERLVERYEDRRDRIRHGFFVYVETHGLEHMVESIEAAVEAVASASTERETVRRSMEEELEKIDRTLQTSFQEPHRRIRSDLQRIERELAKGEIASEDARDVFEAIDTFDDASLSEIDDSIERARTLESRLEQQIGELETTSDQAAMADGGSAEEAVTVVDDELDRLRQQRAEVGETIDRLQSERERIEHASDQLDERKQELEQRIDDTVVGGADGEGIDGSEVVTAATARLFEMDYIGRFDTTMHETETLTLPDESFEVPDDYWEGRSEHRTQASELIRLLDDDADIDAYPTNTTSRYEVTESRYFGLSQSPRMIVEATVYSDLEAHAADGFDTTPAGTEDLLRFVNQAVSEADSKDVPYLLGIASPTGWTDQVKTRIVNDDLARTRYSRRVAVCLVDLREGNLIYDSSDPIVADNVHLFERSVVAERVDECVDTVRSEYLDTLGRETALLEAVVDEHGFDRHVVKRAFERLESNGEGEQFYVDEEGLAFHKE